jgi:tripartite-type tricarboxylate transporter receptor subunit TctC
MKKGIALLLGVFLSASLMAGGQGDSGSGTVGDFKYPTKTVEILVGASPGGDSDLFPRTYAKHLEKMWGVPIIITNYSMNVPACVRIHDAPADGYTALSINDGMLINMVTGVVDFTLDDLTVVGKHSELDGQIIAVRVNSGWNTLTDFAKACEEKPDTYTLAVANSSTTLVMGEMMKALGLKARLVDSDSGGDRLQKLLGGHIDAAFFGWGMIRDYVTSGQWKALCILEGERSKVCPQVPTAKEQGFNAVYPTRHVFYMPKGVDPRIVAEWDKALAALNKDPAFVQEVFDVVAGYAKYANAVETKKILTEEVWPLLVKYLKK